jgi:hypothetical protein
VFFHHYTDISSFDEGHINWNCVSEWSEPFTLNEIVNETADFIIAISDIDLPQYCLFTVRATSFDKMTQVCL